MDGALPFLVSRASTGDDGTFSLEVTGLIVQAIAAGQAGLATDSQDLVWRSVVRHGLLDDQVREACAAHRAELAARLWRLLTDEPAKSLAGRARPCAAALDVGQLDRLVSYLDSASADLPQAGTPGSAALSVLLASEHPAALAELRRRGSADQVLVPSGQFTMGGGLKADENPPTRHWLPSFFIARFPVTVSDLQRFGRDRDAVLPVGAVGPPDWPAHHLTRSLAADLVSSLGGRLPTEPEWEKAARGPAGRRFPWGTEFQPDHANTLESGIGEFTPVDRYERPGQSGYGVVDMVGNSWEWTSSRYQSYGARLRGADPRPLDETADGVLRGGAYDFDEYGSNCVNRYRCHPDRGWDTHGARLVCGL